MVDDQPYTRCPKCHGPVALHELGIVYAVKQASHPGYGQSDDWIDDDKAYFHANCRPESIGYERRPLPDN